MGKGNTLAKKWDRMLRNRAKIKEVCREVTHKFYRRLDALTLLSGAADTGSN